MIPERNGLFGRISRKWSSTTSLKRMGRAEIGNIRSSPSQSVRRLIELHAAVRRYVYSVNQHSGYIDPICWLTLSQTIPESFAEANEKIEIPDTAGCFRLVRSVS